MNYRMIVKVCGIRDGDNIRALEKLNIDWMGFIFYPGSPRYVPDMNEYIDVIQSCSKSRVGVFVNEESAEIVRKVAKYGLHYIQLHGDESPGFCQRLREEGCTVIKAFSVSFGDDLLQTVEYEPFVDFFLFDTKSSQYGGTGKRFDWSVLEAYRGDTPFLLSGGIGVEHVNELLAFAHPLLAGIDLNSRFELLPAVKDIGLIEWFIGQIIPSNSLKGI